MFSRLDIGLHLVLERLTCRTSRALTLWAIFHSAWVKIMVMLSSWLSCIVYVDTVMARVSVRVGISCRMSAGLLSGAVFFVGHVARRSLGAGG